MLLVNADPVRDQPDGPGWAEALRQARTRGLVSCFDDASTKHADVVFPAETYAEKEGTVTHPDGRLQRLRPAVPHPGDVRPIWQVLAELAAALGDETGIDSAPEALAAIAAEVPFYAGITDGGDRRPRRPLAGARRGRGRELPGAGRAASAAARRRRVESTPATLAGDGLRLGTYRDLWADEVTERNPALRFLAPRADGRARAQRTPSGWASTSGDEVDVRSNGTSVRARVAIRERMRPGGGVPDRGHGRGQRERARRRRRGRDRRRSARSE